MAGIYFSETRNVELSTLEYIETQINASWTGITIVKTFKNAYDEKVPVPIVCIRLADTNNARRELGADTLEDRHVIIIDIFACSDGQRIDLADYITDKLKDGWAYKSYSHVSGDKSQITGSSTGRIYVTSWNGNGKIDFGEQGDPKDRFRHIITISVRKSR